MITRVRVVAGIPATTRSAACIDQTSNTAYRAGGRERRMAPRTSSLRQRQRAALTAGVVLAALTSTGAALGAGGAPLPAPDAPPPTESTQSVKEPTAKTSTATSRTEAPAQPKTSTTPSPDPPVSAETATRTAPAPAPVPAPAPAPAPARAAPVAATPVPPAASRPASSATTRANRITPKPKPKPKPKATVAPARKPTTPPVLRSPHDVRRLGLPLARLVPVTGDDPARTALLVAAAVLLAASGAGSLTVGLSVRRLARGA